MGRVEGIGYDGYLVCDPTVCIRTLRYRLICCVDRSGLASSMVGWYSVEQALRLLLHAPRTTS